MTEREDPRLRYRQLLNTAMSIARESGLRATTRQAIATRAGVSTGLVSMHLGTMTNLRRALMRAAVADEELRVVAEGIVLRDPTALRAPQELRDRALRSAMEQDAPLHDKDIRRAPNPVGA